ncbi:hypothetical protein EV361DRAFT_874930 [Lentinula raphanica]|nr:hypothetical protein EV361DRAFT_874930 [Lentinula raphanica]
MRTRYYDESEVVDKNQIGTLKHSQKWLRVSNSLINGAIANKLRREIKVLDSDQKLMFYTNGTLSLGERRRLLLSLTALFSTKPAGVSLTERTKERPGKNTFTTFHFSTWGRYGQNLRYKKRERERLSKYILTFKSRLMEVKLILLSSS